MAAPTVSPRGCISLSLIASGPRRQRNARANGESTGTRRGCGMLLGANAPLPLLCTTLHTTLAGVGHSHTRRLGRDIARADEMALSLLEGGHR